MIRKKKSLQPLDIEAPFFLIMLEIVFKENLDSIASSVKYLINKFGIKDTESRIYGFEFIKKLLYVVVILFFIVSALVIYKPVLLEIPILKASYISLAIYAGFWIYWIIRTTFSKKFAFYLARAFSEVILVKTDEIEKIAFLDKCLSSYNKYLGENISLQINDSAKISSTIICKPITEDHKKLSLLMDILSQTFKSRNKLSPAKYLALLLNFQNIDQFLIRASRAQKAKDLIVLFTGVGSLIIAIVQVFL